MDVRTERESLTLLEDAIADRDWRLAQLLIWALDAGGVRPGLVERAIDAAGAGPPRVVWGLGEVSRALRVDT